MSFELTLHFHIYIVESPKGKEKIWLVGDNWLAELFRPIFKKSKQEEEFYMKEHYDITSFCSSKYNDKNQNMISRLQITVAAAINKEKYLPKFMLILLDDELINYLDFTKCGQSPMMGDWIQWLASQIDEMVKTKKSYLPVRAEQDNKPAIYWNALPLHQAWWDNEPRIKYNNIRINSQNIHQHEDHHCGMIFKILLMKSPNSSNSTFVILDEGFESFHPDGHEKSYQIFKILLMKSPNSSNSTFAIPNEGFESFHPDGHEKSHQIFKILLMKSPNSSNSTFVIPNEGFESFHPDGHEKSHQIFTILNPTKYSKFCS